MDQDDRIEPEYFRNQLMAIGENDAVICKAIHNKKCFYPNDDNFLKIVSKEYMLGKWNHILSPGQVLLRKKSIPTSWSETILKYNGADDWFLWLCMLAEECSFALNCQILYEHVMHDKNTSDNILSMVQSQQEVISTVWEKEIFKGDDLKLLLDAFFVRFMNYIWELTILRKRFRILDVWMKARESGTDFGEYLLRSGVKTCGIYGCGILGEHLYDELKRTVHIKFFIDRNAANIHKNIPVYTDEDVLPETDMIIIALLNEADAVDEKIKKKFCVKTLVFTDWLMKNGVDRKLFLFGIGKIAERYTEFLRQLPVEIYGYVDNDINRCGTFFYDRKIYAPEILKEEEESAVLIACDDIEGITEQLTRMGVHNKIISLDHIIRKGLGALKPYKSNVRNIKE